MKNIDLTVKTAWRSVTTNQNVNGIELPYQDQEKDEFGGTFAIWVAEHGGRYAYFKNYGSLSHNDILKSFSPTEFKNRTGLSLRAVHELIQTLPADNFLKGVHPNDKSKTLSFRIKDRVLPGVLRGVLSERKAVLLQQVDDIEKELEALRN